MRQGDGWESATDGVFCVQVNTITLASVLSSPIISCVEASLERLRTPYIDLFYTHAWDEGTPLQETLSTLNSLQEAGKVIKSAY